MIPYNDLKPGVIFVLDGEPWQVQESNFLRMQQRKPVNQTKIRNLITGKTVSRNFQPSDKFQEAEIIRDKKTFLYDHRDKYIFCQQGERSQRTEIEKDILGDAIRFLKPNSEVEFLKFGEKIISVSLPVKIDLKVVEAPPGIKGDTAQGGTKTVKLETGAEINAPLFVEVGDIVRVNTQTGQYTERVEKGK